MLSLDRKFEYSLNGELIKMSTDMRILFEVDHLKMASPASISRCGIVFMN